MDVSQGRVNSTGFYKIVKKKRDHLLHDVMVRKELSVIEFSMINLKALTITTRVIFTRAIFSPLDINVHTGLSDIFHDYYLLDRAGPSRLRIMKERKM